MDTTRPGTDLPARRAVGDVGLLIATFLLFSSVGSIDYQQVVASMPQLPGVTVIAAVLLLFLPAAGKSAQLSLHVLGVLRTVR